MAQVSMVVPGPGVERVLTPEVRSFLAELESAFGGRRADLLRRRHERRTALAGNPLLDSREDTRDVRSDPSWRVAEAPADLVDRRVEITGPTDAKMLINALNSGASAHMSDFEDSNAPRWDNLVTGQANLIDAVTGTLAHSAPDGRRYALAERTATLVNRPRGWHLTEPHVEVDGKPMSAALFDFGTFFRHNAVDLVARGSGPYFYLPKLESHEEARLWNDVFLFAQDAVGLPRGTVRATVLVETIQAAFEMDEILFELREHASGLNAGRWDYMFSLIKQFRDAGAAFVLPDRNTVTMTVPFMHAYTELLVATCHRRGAYAIGGMAAYIPNRRDPAANEAALRRVRDDKVREARAGFDGTWVAHPDLVPVARAVFEEELGGAPHQLARQRDDMRVTAEQLLDVRSTPGTATLAGLRNNVAVSLRYLESWLRGTGAVALFDLMEDVATAEIARSQVWHWRHCGVRLEDGTPVTRELVLALVDEELESVRSELGDGYADRRFDDATRLFVTVALDDELVEFLTVPGGEFLR